MSSAYHLSWATLQSAWAEKGLNSAGSPGETGQGLCSTAEQLQPQNSQTRGRDGAREPGPILDHLAQNLPHSVKLLQHKLARQDSNFPRQQVLSWAPHGNDMRETPPTFFLSSSSFFSSSSPALAAHLCNGRVTTVSWLLPSRAPTASGVSGHGPAAYTHLN